MLQLRKAAAPMFARTDIPDAAPPGVQADIQASTSMYTYFTRAGETRLLYSAPTWIRVTLFLETSGPVSVGTRQQIAPVLSGKGTLLPSGGPFMTFDLAKGDRLFIAAESVNRVKFTAAQKPFLQQILSATVDQAQATKKVVQAVTQAITSFFNRTK